LNGLDEPFDQTACRGVFGGSMQQLDIESIAGGS